MARSTQGEEEDEWPDEVELLLHADGPEVLERPHGFRAAEVVEEEERAEDVNSREGEAACEAKEDDDANVEVERRQDAKDAPEVEGTQTDGAVLCMFLQQETGDQEAADFKEDEDPAGSIEECEPTPGDMMIDADALGCMQGDDEKDGEGAQAIETGDSPCGCGTWLSCQGHARYQPIGLQYRTWPPMALEGQDGCEIEIARMEECAVGVVAEGGMEAIPGREWSERMPV